MDIHSDLDQEQSHYSATAGDYAETAEETDVMSMQKQVRIDAANETGADSKSENLTHARESVDNAFPLSSERQSVKTELTPTECLFVGEWIGYFRDQEETQ